MTEAEDEFWEAVAADAIRHFFQSSGAFEQDYNYSDFNEAFLEEIIDWTFSRANYYAKPV